MTREIKFRFWNPNIKTLTEAGTLQRMLKFEAEFPDRWDGNIVFMQFTGLFDKNGKEIYEGDITLLGDITRVVEFKDGSFIGWHNECEIIGNIYENPNLINPHDN